MRTSPSFNAGARVSAPGQSNLISGRFVASIVAANQINWRNDREVQSLKSTGAITPPIRPGDSSNWFVRTQFNRQIKGADIYAPVYLKPPTYFTNRSVFPTAPGLRQVSLLERQLAGRLKETSQAYVFTKSSTAVNTAEAILKDILKLLTTQAELLKNSNDLAIRVYDADDVAYPVEGGISFVAHRDFAWIQIQTLRSQRTINLGRLDDRVLY